MGKENKIKKSFILLKRDILEVKKKISLLSNQIEIKKDTQAKESSVNELKKIEEKFKDKTILITGGCGFIGSNLAHKLVSLNPKKIIIADSLINGLGGNLFNINDIKNKVKCYIGKQWDLRNIEKMKEIIQDVDYVFNLAGSTSHIGSKEDPLFDLELNLRSHVYFLEACRQCINERKKPLKIVYAGTRDQYGKVPQKALPVMEDHPISNATDSQGINKNAAEFYHFWYRNFGIQVCSLRLGNIYGPRHIMTDPGQGVLNWFIRQAIDNETLELWGEGEPLRDFIYVEDVVEALLVAMVSEKTDDQAYNLGAYRKKAGMYEHLCDGIKSIRDVAKIVVDIVGSGFCKIIPYPEDRKSLEPGHFYADATKIYEDIGWEAKTNLKEGLKKTISFYRENKKEYWKSNE